MSGSGPRTIGNFTIERELGAGGMGVVLLGRHQSLDRPAVLKRLRPELAASEDLVERFAREARAAAAIHHQNVVAVYDWISWRGEHYIAQEYVDGVDLRVALAQAQRFPWRIAALVALELARGLEAIHARGMVHRDLKPANVLLGRNGDVKIADFGIAIDATSDGLTRPGTTIGSPPYIAPEQLLGERVDARGDLFGLGVVLYELLTGAPPYREPAGGETDSLLTRIQRERFEPVRRVSRDAPRWLARLVRALVRAKPRSRPASAQRVRRLLESRLRAFPAEAKLELASWLWEEGVFRPREGDTVVLSAEATPRRRMRRGRALAYAATALCALSIGSFAVVRGVSPGALVDRARELASHSGAAAGSARVRFATDQRLRVAIDGAAPVAVEPGDQRELVPGRHRLVFEWPSGAHDAVELELGAGEQRSVRPVLPQASGEAETD
jgi:predicted Ser/Thr protein kinase